MDKTNLNKQLILAARNGDFSKLKITLKNGADINYHDEGGGKTALCYAAELGTDGVIEYLLDHGADIEVKVVDQWTPLIFAAWEGHKECLEMLYRRGANINYVCPSDGKTALHYAVQHGNMNAAIFLIDHGININHKNKDGDTALDFLKTKAYHQDSKEHLQLFEAYLEQKKLDAMIVTGKEMQKQMEF